MKWLNDYRMRLLLVGIVAGIVIGGGRAKADFTWVRKSDMPIKKLQHSTNVVGGKIYSIGGWAFENGQWEALTRVDEYDPTTDTWTRKADMPTGRGHTNACVVDDKIYVIGGDASENPIISIVEVYDPATDTWKEQTNLPSQRYWFSTCVVDGIIYVIGGNTGSQGGWTHLNTVEAYDTTTDTWTRKTSMSGLRSFTSSCVVDGKIYVTGGAWWRGCVEEYDPATDAWTRKADMPTPRYGHDTVVVDSKIYAIGGWYHSINGPIYSTVEVYDPLTDTWTKGIDIPVTTAGFSASVVDGKIYVMGGATATHGNDNWIFTSAVYVNEPIVDFNGDGIVNFADMCIMVDHWGTDEPLFDICPMPFGDCIVDVQDLKVLMNYWGQINLVVDDFENYKNNPPDEIFRTWIVGYDVETNGATIGYLDSDIDAGEHFVETESVHGGSQSMPFFYNNNGAASYSEAERMFNPAQDWTRGDAKALSLWFRGHPVYIFEEGPAGTFTMSASGTDIWDNSDEFHFAWKQVSGAASIIAKIESVENVHEWSKAGVMIRDTLEPGSRHAMVAITPNKGVWFGRREAADGESYGTRVAGINAPQWVKLERTIWGGLVRAYYSADGTIWTQLGNATVMMNTPMYIGPALTSHKSGVVCEAKFSNISFPDTDVALQWNHQDIGIISNEAAPMYMTIANDDGSTATVYHDNPNAPLIDSWTEWNISLQIFADQGVNLTNINSIAIGFGDKDNPQHGGSGLVYFDDIMLCRQEDTTQN